MGQSGSKAKKAAKGSPVKGSPIKEEPVVQADVKADVENKAPNTTETKTEAVAQENGKAETVANGEV